MSATDKNYQELASAIVEVACADYVDAMIIAKRGYLTANTARKKLYDLAIKYGASRYIIRDKNGEIKRSSERRNMNNLRALCEHLPQNRKDSAMREAKQLEKFFKSEYFNVLMPNTDAEWLLQQMRFRAHLGRRFISAYSGKSEADE